MAQNVFYDKALGLSKPECFLRQGLGWFTVLHQLRHVCVNTTAAALERSTLCDQRSSRPPHRFGRFRWLKTEGFGFNAHPIGSTQRRPTAAGTRRLSQPGPLGLFAAPEARRHRPRNPSGSCSMTCSVRPLCLKPFVLRDTIQSAMCVCVCVCVTCSMTCSMTCSVRPLCLKLFVLRDTIQSAICLALYIR